MAVTRIKNNQITDSTITYAKIATGTLVGTNFNANLTLNSNVTILGNLTVANNYIQLNSINTYINDPIVVYNNNYTGSLTGYDIGMLVNRNLASLGPYGSVNTFWGWVEADQSFEALATTDTGTGITSINNSGYANVKMGNTTVTSMTITGDASGATGNIGGLQAKAIGNITPGTGAFTTLTSSGTTIASGNIVAASGTASTSTTTGALVVVGGIGASGAVNIGSTATVSGNIVAASGTASTNTTTGALVVVGGIGASGAIYAGSVQNTPIGSSTASTGAFTTLSASSDTSITSATASTSTTTGALKVTGGVGIGGNLNVGGISTLTGNVNIGGNLTVTGQSVSIGASTLSIVDPIISLNTPADLSPLTVVTTSDIGIKFHYYDSADSHAFLGRAVDTGYLEWYAKGNDTANVFTGTVYGTTKMGGAVFANARTVGGGLTANTGTLQVWGDGSITGNLYTGSTLTVGGATALSSTLGVTGATTLSTATAGGLQAQAIGNVTPGTGAFTTLTSSGTTIASGNIVAASTTESTSTTTGSLVTLGGVGIAGNVYHGKAAVFNSGNGAGNDFIVKGNTNNTLIWARPSATYDAVLVGNSAVQANVVTGAKFQIFSTDSMLLPVGTNAQRPSSVGQSDITGMFRYSTTQNAIEWYNGSSWTAASTSFTVIADQQFNGDGSTTAFTLSEAQTTNSCIVSINGVIQIPTLAYSVSTTTLTFTEAPASGDVIDVRKLTTTSTVTGIASTNGYMQFQVDNSGAYVYTGSGSTAVTTYWETGGGEVNSRANVTASGTGDTLLDSFTNTVFSSGEYHVTATIPGTNIRETAKIIVVQDGTTATRAVYGVVSTAGNTLVTYTANISAGATRIYGTPTNSGTIFRVKKNYQAI